MECSLRHIYAGRHEYDNGVTMRITLGDRFRAFISPMQAGGYDGAVDSRFRNTRAFNRSVTGTEETILGPTDRNRLRLECRDLWRNNEIVRGLVDRFTDYAIWNGLFPQWQTSSPDWNDEAEAWWKQVVVPTADHRQIQSVDLIELQKLAISHRILDGDLGFILLKNGQVQSIEGDRICTPQKFSSDKTVTEGIRRTAGGIITGYFICDRLNGGAIDTKKFKFVSRENFIHAYKPGRIDQIRGIPDLAPAINKLKDYDETDEAVMGKVKMDAKHWATSKTSSGRPNIGRRNATTLTDADSKNKTIVEKIEDLRIIHQGPDDSLDAFESKTPNNQYVPYLKHELQAISASLNISYEVLMLIFTDGSFSSQRAALIHNKHTFLGWTSWSIKSIWNRHCNWRTAKAMKNGEISPAPIIDGQSEWFKKTWTIPFFDWVDPLKQSKAEKQSYEIGTTNLKMLNASRGQDRDDVLKGKEDDIRKAIEMAKKIKDETDEDVSWKDFINIGVKEEVPAGGGI